MKNTRSNIARTVRRLLDKYNLYQEDVSITSGLDKSTISRLLNQRHRTDPATLDGLLQSFPDAEDRFALVLAHLQDELSLNARAVIVVTPRSTRVKRGGNLPLDTKNLSLVGFESLAFLLQKPHIEPIFIDLAHAIGWEPNTPTPLRRGGGKEAENKALISLLVPVPVRPSLPLTSTTTPKV